MNIVIPMAGLGTRFRNSGFRLPKPLILVGNKPMYQYAVDCLPLHLATKLVFIVREDDYSEALIENIKKHYSGYNLAIVLLPSETQGQAQTVLFGRDYLNKAAPTLIHNCDTCIGQVEWELLFQSHVDGAIVLFASQEDRWSYAKLDSRNDFVIDIQEKKVISTHASTGTYFFKDTKNLLQLIEQSVTENKRQSGEFYISSIYQYMIPLNKKIIPLFCEEMLCFGTPADLVDSLNHLLTHTSETNDC